MKDGVTVYPGDAGAKMAWEAPGTTRITHVDFRDVHEVDDRSRQTSRLGLFEGTQGGASEGTDFFDPDQVNDVPLIGFDDDGTARFAVAWMFTSPCTVGGTPACAAIRKTSLAVEHVGSVDLTLVDNEAPTAKASGSPRDLADSWSAPSGTQTVTGAFADGGSGVDHGTLTVTGVPLARQPADATPAHCDPTHNDPELKNQICPSSTSQTFDVDMGGLPEGKTHFDLQAFDFAGNASGDAWDVYVDRTAPTLALAGALRDAADTWVDPAAIAAGVHLQAKDNLSGVASIDLKGTDESKRTTIDVQQDVCSPRNTIAAPCATQNAISVPLNADALQDGTLDLSASAVDYAGQRSDPVTWSVHVDRTAPAAHAEGDLVALQDRWTNRSGPVDVTVSGRDAGAGVKQLQLVAVNADGRQVVGQADTCSVADVDPADGSCPHRVTRTLTVDPSELPDGKSTFAVEAVDLAGHVSRQDQSWDTYLDHTPPPTPTDLVVKATSTDTAALSWDRVVDDLNGSAGVSYQYLVKAGEQTVVNWTTTPYPAAVVPGLPQGVDITVLVRSLDVSGNLSPDTTASAQLPGFEPDGADSETSAHAAGVERFVTDHAPFVSTDFGDGFYPISFYWIPRMETIEGDVPCIHDKERCVRRITMPLKGKRGANQYIEYPAPNNRYQQEALIDYTLRSVGGYMGAVPQHDAAMGYYLVSKHDEFGNFVVQYWYFWSYNYYDASLFHHHVVDADQHEGDLEHVDITFNSKGHPTWVTMSRHALKQYRSYHWDDPRLSKIDAHVNVFAAEGDHAIYEKCNSGLGFQLYDDDGAIPAWDHTCGHGGPITAALPSQVTGKLNNATKSWACWQGKLGNHGPGAPLRQSTAPGVQPSDTSPGLCPRPKVPGVARATARTTNSADANPAYRCGSYEHPPDSGAGVVAVACDQQDLAASTGSTETAPVAWGLASGARLEQDDGPPAVAVSDDPDVSGQLQLVARRASHPEIYISTVHAGIYAHVRFPAQAMSAGQTLRVATPASGTWTLTGVDGTILATADPQRQTLPVPPRPHGPRPPAPVRLQLRRGAHTSTLRWVAVGASSRGVRFAVLATPRNKPKVLTVVIAQMRAHGQRHFSVRINNRLLVGRTIRVVANRGSRSRASHAIRGLRRR